jgi:flagellum-specific peptidoglycan hydrolase FlgJ
MEEKITQRGFYFLLGIIVVFFINWLREPSNSIIVQKVPVEIKKDTIIKQKDSLNLNAHNVKKVIIKHKIPHPDIVLAQAKLESGNFTSKLSKTHNNIFGLKTGNKYTRYTHWSECVADYATRISSRYKGGNYYQFLDRINYARDPDYTSRLKAMV